MLLASLIFLRALFHQGLRFCLWYRQLLVFVCFCVVVLALVFVSRCPIEGLARRTVEASPIPPDELCARASARCVVCPWFGIGVCGKLEVSGHVGVAARVHVCLPERYLVRRTQETLATLLLVSQSYQSLSPLVVSD